MPPNCARAPSPAAIISAATIAAAVIHLTCAGMFAETSLGAIGDARLRGAIPLHSRSSRSRKRCRGKPNAILPDRAAARSHRSRSPRLSRRMRRRKGGHGSVLRAIRPRWRRRRAGKHFVTEHGECERKSLIRAHFPSLWRRRHGLFGRFHLRSREGDGFAGPVRILALRGERGGVFRRRTGFR